MGTASTVARAMTSGRPEIGAEWKVLLSREAMHFEHSVIDDSALPGKAKLQVPSVHQLLVCGSERILALHFAQGVFGAPLSDIPGCPPRDVL